MAFPANLWDCQWLICLPGGFFFSALWTLLRTGTIKLGPSRYYIWTVMTSKGFLGLGSVFFFFIFVLWVFCLHACLCTTFVQPPVGSEEIIVVFGTGVIDSCKLPCGCGNWNWTQFLGSLEEQPVLVTTEPSLQTLSLFFFKALFLFSMN